MNSKRHVQKTVATLLMSMLCLISFAQSRTVSGIVLDAHGESVIGANVKAVGSTTGTITDLDGAFSISVPAETKQLEISYIGMKPQVVDIKGKNSLNITLVEDTEMLDEVVVIGYGTVKKKDLTGSVASIKQADIVAIPTTNVLESLQGKVAGLDMTKSSGQAGSGVSFTIRGNRSLNASNAPLVLVDGVPYGSDLDINPDIIESIDVLKDASSTAIYGSRGANGVVLITTKQGKTNKTQISYNGYYSVDNAWDYPELMNTQQYANYVREANRAAGYWTSEADDPKIFTSEYDFIKNNVNIDWIDLILRTGFTTSHSANLSYGGEKTKLNASFQYQKQKGLQANDDMQRYTGNLSVIHDISTKLTLNASAIVSHTNRNYAYDAFNMAVKYPPYGTPFDEDGNIVIYPYNNGQTISPLAETIPDNYARNSSQYRVFASGGLQWKPIKGLIAKTNFNVNITNFREGSYYGAYTTAMGGTYSKASAQNKSNNNWTWETSLNYEFDINKKHNFQLLVGNEVQRGVSEVYDSEGRDLLSSAMLWYNLAACQLQQKIGSQYTKTTMLSYFGRLNYKFNERYLLTATLRYDGSSVLADGNKWALFPSVAVAWRINEEDFMKRYDWLSNLKFRASYGVSGNSAVDAYETQGGLGQTMYVFDMNNTEVGQYGYWPTSIPNHDLSWEKTATTNIGLDVGLFNNRVNLTADWYLQNTTDLLMQKQIPSTNGYKSTWSNVGETRNTGIEVVLNTQNIIKKSFTWSTDVTFTKNKEEIVKLSDGADRDIANGWFVGHPISVYYTLDKIGIWQTDEAEEAAKYGYKPGQVKNRDVDENDKIDANDRVIIGTPRPDFVMGLNNRFKIKNFDFSFFLLWRKGSMMKLNDFFSIGATSRGFAYIDYWTPENPTNAFPRPDLTFSNNDISLSGLSYEDASFLKVRDITLGYTLPKNVLKAAKISNVRLYCTMKNFFQFNNLSCDGYDAERLGGYGYPTTKQVVIGINVDF